jgi:hypothetical protein
MPKTATMSRTPPALCIGVVGENGQARMEGTRSDPLVGSVARRDPLVGSVAPGWIIHFASAGMTGTPLRFLLSEGRACRVRCSEGRACRVRGARLDNPFHFSGHDRHAPPILAFGGTRLSRPLLGGTRLSGPLLGGTCLSGPWRQVG